MYPRIVYKVDTLSQATISQEQNSDDFVDFH